MNKKKLGHGKIKKRDMQEILNKNFPSATCQHCGKVTDIQFLGDFRKLVSRNRTLGELNKTLRENWHRWMNIKNGQIEAMHKMIARFVKLIPEEQKKKAKEMTQEIRDEIKNAEKRQNSKIYKYKSSNNISMLPGDPSGSPDESFFSGSKNNETLFFIDDGFLSKLSKYFGKGKYLKFDKIGFAKELANKERLICKKIFYYLAPPFQSEPPTKEEESLKEGHDKFVKKLREKEVIVREGRCQRLKINGRFKYNQKGVDVLLTMDLALTPLKYSKIKKIILIVCDSDFVPVIRSLRDFGIKTILYTYYEKKRDTDFSRSNDLIKSVHKYVLLSKKDFDDAVLDKGKKKDGKKKASKKR